MTLFPFLSLSVVFCALGLIVVGQSRERHVIPVILIAVEILLLLQHEGMLEFPIGSRAEMRSAGSAVVVLAAFVELLKSSEKTFSLLAAFAGLQQLLVSLGVIRGISL